MLENVKNGYREFYHSGTLRLNMFATTKCITKKERRSKFSKSNEKKQGRSHSDIIFKK